jgi:spermidine synthase
MQYNIKTVPFFTVKEKSFGSVDIIDHGSHFALYNNGDVWMSYEKGGDTEIRQMYSSYDLAYGDVLISGLGFGILALWLCSKPEVDSVTVVEISEDVIKLFKESNECPKKLTIINDNMVEYNTDKKYDVLLLDHYERQSFDWRIKDINRIWYDHYTAEGNSYVCDIIDKKIRNIKFIN